MENSRNSTVSSYKMSIQLFDLSYQNKDGKEIVFRFISEESSFIIKRVSFKKPLTI